MPTNGSIADHAAVSRNPATGEEIERFPFQSSAEIEQVLSSADAAFKIWRAQSVTERAAVYTRLAATLRARIDEIAPVITREMGKITKEARGEVEKCAATAEWYAEHGPALLADEPTKVEGDDQVYVSPADRHHPRHHALEFPALADDPRGRSHHAFRQRVRSETCTERDALRLHDAGRMGSERPAEGAVRHPECRHRRHRGGHRG